MGWIVFIGTLLGSLLGYLCVCVGGGGGGKHRDD